jgi:3-oxoacyl-[acyl-carrier-protein] synthase III
MFADSIGAMVFSRADSGNMIRYTSVMSNAEFRDMFVLDDNGVYQLDNLHKGRDLTEFMVKSFATQFREGCMAMKTMPKNLDYIAMSCSTYGATQRVLEAMNFPLEKTGLSCLTEVPHMGTNDLIFQLEYGLEQGLIKDGSKILVTGTSLGFSMATMAIEWGV